MKLRYVIVYLLVYWAYDWFAYPLERGIPDKLDDVVEEVEKYQLDQKIKFFALWDDHSRPASVHGSLPQEVFKSLSGSNIYVAYFSMIDGDVSSASFIVDRLLGSLRSRWYYTYDADGLMEEEVVPSLSGALERKNYPYHYCEKANIENWFFCTSNDL